MTSSSPTQGQHSCTKLCSFKVQREAEKQALLRATGLSQVPAICVAAC